MELEEAQAEAEYYSSKGYKAAIMEWYADYRWLRKQGKTNDCKRVD